MSLTGHRMPPRTTQQSHRPRVSDRTMVGTLPPRCLQPLPHSTKNAATDGPGYRATPRSTTEPHRAWMSDTYLLHLHAEGEKCFLLTSPFIEPAPTVVEVVFRIACTTPTEVWEMAHHLRLQRVMALAFEGLADHLFCACNNTGNTARSFSSGLQLSCCNAA